MLPGLQQRHYEFRKRFLAQVQLLNGDPGDHDLNDVRR